MPTDINAMQNNICIPYPVRNVWAFFMPVPISAFSTFTYQYVGKKRPIDETKSESNSLGTNTPHMKDVPSEKIFVNMLIKFLFDEMLAIIKLTESDTKE